MGNIPGTEMLVRDLHQKAGKCRRAFRARGGMGAVLRNIGARWHAGTLARWHAGTLARGYPVPVSVPRHAPTDVWSEGTTREI